MCDCLKTVPAPLSPNQIRNLVQQENAKNPRADCTYPLETLLEYRNILNCVKSNNIYDLFSVTQVKINSYIGIVQSAINYTTNPCYFEPQLDEIKVLIDKIKENGQCQ